jgi:hypothetical protein
VPSSRPAPEPRSCSTPMSRGAVRHERGASSGFRRFCGTTFPDLKGPVAVPGYNDAGYSGASATDFHRLPFPALTCYSVVSPDNPGEKQTINVQRTCGKVNPLRDPGSPKRTYAAPLKTQSRGDRRSPSEKFSP